MEVNNMATKKTDTNKGLEDKTGGEVKISPRTGKPMKKPRGGNSPVIGMNGYNLEAGDNTKILKMNIELMNMPNINLEDTDEVAQRLTDYFSLYAKYDMKPTVVGMAIALNGHSRQWLWALTHNQPMNGNGAEVSLPPDVADLIKKAYNLMENQWETYMNSGKVNPVAGIFLGKNNYGYQDKTEYVLTPNAKQDGDYDAEDIKERYLPVKAIEDKSSDSD